MLAPALGVPLAVGGSVDLANPIQCFCGPGSRVSVPRNFPEGETVASPHHEEAGGVSELRLPSCQSCQYCEQHEAHHGR